MRVSVSCGEHNAANGKENAEKDAGVVHSCFLLSDVLH